MLLLCNTTCYACYNTCQLRVSNLIKLLVNIMPAESLKSKLDGNELDLSLSGLTTVPVKELSALPKATYLDLSCNLLTFIESDFCSLFHLVKIDLSKNKLTELPENFGNLQKLQHLDLYQNKLTSLPLTFCRLNALKWLDIRDNPLKDGGLLAAGGDCLSESQCRNCAKQVVVYMKKVQSDHERERQKMLKEQREKEAFLKAQEEHELQKKRADKKAEKERRRQQVAKKATEESKDEEGKHEDYEDQSFSNGQIGLELKPMRNGLSCFQLILTVLLLAIAACCGLYVFCSGTTSQDVNNYCTITVQLINNLVTRFHAYYDTLLIKLNILMHGLQG